MTTYGTALAYPTSVAETLPYDFDADWAVGFARFETTDVQQYEVELFGGTVFVETAGRASSMVGSQSESWLEEKLLARLGSLERTPMDERWPGAVWPDAQAFRDADTFIHRLPLASIPKPEISLADDGEINFLWENDGVYVDLGFYGTRTFSFFARDKDGRRIHGEDVQASNGLPHEVTALLTA